MPTITDRLTRIEVLMEDLLERFNTLVGVVVEMRQDMHNTKEDVIEIKADLKVMKAAIIDTSRQVDDHETRISRLEPPLSGGFWRPKNKD